ncbi:F-box domain-containing protein [Mycena sanguinolenta]|uniref:F-box domain-containing protein n=1 Tax=Mycena sanguinolenta TaxID=230812 RepID=A0A8H6X776_9AGAR|nr:F-box domain-containing protein [Mycena sanguinolenta]
MSGNSLPDEIISEILCPALKVPDELFSDNWGIDTVGPFVPGSPVSTAAYLLVSKSWLRVATPLLYNVVILRSKAQAKALSLALLQNAELGRFIKKLRVEGGYGQPMRIILQCAPNISDLFLSLLIYSADNTSGLCKGLPLINPTRLILRDNILPKENKMISQLTEALVQALSKWDRLCVLELPHTAGSVRYSKIFQPLLESKRLHTLVIHSAISLSWAYSTFKECPLKLIRLKQPATQSDRIDKTDPVLMALLQYTEAPHFPKWDRLCVLELPYIFESDRFTKLIRPLLESRRLHTLTIPEVTSLSWVYSEFRACPLQSIHIKEPVTEWDQEEIDEADPVLKALLKYTAEPAGGTARAQDAIAEFPLIAPPLNPFFIPMADAPEEVQDKIWARVLYSQLSKTFARLGLPHYYSCVVLEDPSAVVKFATVLRSNPSIGPSIRSLNIDYYEFPDEEELASDVVSTMLSLTTGLGDLPAVDDFDPPQEVPSLVKITLDMDFWFGSNKDQIAQWDNFFVKFAPKRLPNLREIKFSCCVWPTTERDISRSCWVRWAEILLKHGINLTDMNGKKWRPRLKVR